jgi:hypothetical protein
MCLTCWQPFEDEAPRPVSQAVPAQATAYAAYAPAPVAAPPQPFGARAFIAGPVTITPAGHRAAGARRNRGAHVVVAVVVAALVVSGAGGWLMFRHSQTTTEQRIAQKFHDATPLALPAGVAAIPEVDAGPTGATVDPRTFLASVDPIVRRATGDIDDLGNLLDGWAAGKVSDSRVRTHLVAFMTDLAPFTDLTEQSPDSLYSAVKDLVTAANGYTIASGGLLDWLDTRTDDARSRYFTVVGNAAASWESGVTVLYAGSGVAAPALPYDHG